MYLIRILPGKKLPAHFFVHKGEEAGYVIEGAIKMVSQSGGHVLETGDAVYLKTDVPTQWINQGPTAVLFLWMKIR